MEDLELKDEKGTRNLKLRMISHQRLKIHTLFAYSSIVLRHLTDPNQQH
jgi:hypothetical protein